jgi:hypothetical protein
MNSIARGGQQNVSEEGSVWPYSCPLKREGAEAKVKGKAARGWLCRSHIPARGSHRLVV